MRLSDVMGNAGLSGYAIVALILFVAAFVGVVVWTFRPGRRREMEAMGRLPFDDGAPAPPAADAGDAARGGTAR